MILSSILIESFEKNDPLNLIKLILKFGSVWIPLGSLDIRDSLALLELSLE